MDGIEHLPSPHPAPVWKFLRTIHDSPRTVFVSDILIPHRSDFTLSLDR
jgi:hypothetical protein